jgi:predicted protein tyrosine phosphatase
MEKPHQAKLTAKFRAHLTGKRLVRLNIPDMYSYMNPAEIQLLHHKLRDLMIKVHAPRG